MSRPAILSDDPMLRQREIFHYDDADDTFTIEKKTDVTSILEHNKMEQVDNLDKRFGGDGMVRVASIPMAKLMELQEQGILGDQKRFKAWLNSPDNRFYRTRGGWI